MAARSAGDSKRSKEGRDNDGADSALDWISEGYGADTRPAEATMDPRSWAATNDTSRDVHAWSLSRLDATDGAATGPPEITLTCPGAARLRRLGA